MMDTLSLNHGTVVLPAFSPDGGNKKIILTPEKAFSHNLPMVQTL